MESESAPWGGTRQDATRNPRTPFKIFDNVYYVGLETVCAYLVTTSTGLVLIDATYADTADAVLNSVRMLGFDPANIKYIFITHSHTDHLGGAAKIKQVSGAPVGMSAEDWAVTNRPAIEKDLVLKDGQTITGSLDDIQKSLANPATGTHPSVLGSAKINEWLDAVIDITKQKLAAGQ